MVMIIIIIINKIIHVYNSYSNKKLHPDIVKNAQNEDSKVKIFNHFNTKHINND